MSTFSYQKKYNKNAKYLRISVFPNKKIIVTVPRGVSDSVVDKFIKDKTDWISRNINIFKNFIGVSYPFSGRKNYLKYKESARVLIKQKVEYFNQCLGFSYKNITIKNQKTRWGSCSETGNLNFNYKILFLPERLQDYIIIHELCHLRELNHSKKYWSLVASIIPNYKILEKELKKNFKL